MVFINVGPEVYGIKRLKQGGTYQNGRMDGLRAGFDRIKSYGWYLGADYLYASGRLKGETVTGRTLKSVMTDQIFEVRGGFTLQQNTNGYPFFIPFLGAGHFKEINDFKPPSPLTCKFADSFNYAACGFLSGVNLNPLLSMGINFKVRLMLDGQSHVTNDPKFNEVHLTMLEETHYRVELPITLMPPNTLGDSFFQLVPFYEFRHFGGREGFPFNFIDTKFHLYGLRASIIYGF